MKKLKISGILSALCFAGLCSVQIVDKEPFLTLGSKILWHVDKNYHGGMGIYFYNDDYVISPSAKTSADYEFEQMRSLKEKLDADGIELLYVNKPTKYLDDSIFLQYRIESYCNDNADRLLSRLDEAGIKEIDLRDNIRSEGLDIYSMFYHTDHHWTVPSGKWGAEKIAEALNEKCGYNIDTSVYADENYTFKTNKNSWLGEQGAKFAGSGIKKDDYTLVTPDFETDYTSGDTRTDFTKLFINDPNECRHYNYMAKSCVNNKVAEGNILMLGDSYDMVTEPFLSLGVHRIDFLIMRDQSDDFNLYNDVIRNGGYDTVIVCYAPFMIGAHSDAFNANQNMFSFE